MCGCRESKAFASKSPGKPELFLSLLRESSSCCFLHPECTRQQAQTLCTLIRLTAHKSELTHYLILRRGGGRCGGTTGLVKRHKSSLTHTHMHARTPKASWLTIASIILVRLEKQGGKPGLQNQSWSSPQLSQTGRTRDCGHMHRDSTSGDSSALQGTRGADLLQLSRRARIVQRFCCQAETWKIQA